MTSASAIFCSVPNVIAPLGGLRTLRLVANSTGTGAVFQSGIWAARAVSAADFSVHPMAVWMRARLLRLVRRFGS